MPKFQYMHFLPYFSFYNQSFFITFLEIKDTHICTHTSHMCTHTGAGIKKINFTTDFLLKHQRSHEDPAALRFNFYEVITTGHWAPSDLKTLQRRCLVPGWYAVHIERWLTYFATSQVMS